MKTALAKSLTWSRHNVGSLFCIAGFCLLLFEVNGVGRGLCSLLLLLAPTCFAAIGITIVIYSLRRHANCKPNSHQGLHTILTPLLAVATLIAQQLIVVSIYQLPEYRDASLRQVEAEMGQIYFVLAPQWHEPSLIPGWANNSNDYCLRVGVKVENNQMQITTNSDTGQPYWVCINRDDDKSCTVPGIGEIEEKNIIIYTKRDDLILLYDSTSIDVDLKRFARPHSR